MSKAQVSINSIQQYKNNVCDVLNASKDVISAINIINDLLSEIDKEISKANEAISNFSSDYENGNSKLDSLESKLSMLEAELAATPEIIKKEVYCGDDENGNPIYEIIEEPNPKYYALLAEISEVNSKISQLTSALSDLLNIISELKNLIYKFNDGKNILNTCKNDIYSYARDIYNKSSISSELLEKAIKAINEYLSVSVNLKPVPSHQSVNWFTPDYNFNTLTENGEAVIYTTRNMYDYVRNNTVFYGVNGKHLPESTYTLLREQGRVRKDYQGTCGLTTSANILRQLGLGQYTEEDLLNRALELNACRNPSFMKTGGGTTNSDILKIMHSYDLKPTLVRDLTLEEIDECISNGGAMMMSVRSKHISNNPKIPSFLPMKVRTNHWVTVTGICKDEYTGEITGVYVQDTGGFNSECHIYIPKNNFNKMRNICQDFTGVAVFK